SLSFFFHGEDGMRGFDVTGVQTCALPIATRRTGCGPRQEVPRRREAGALLRGSAATGALRGGAAPLAADHIRNAGLPRTLRVEGRLVTEPKRWAPDRTRLLVDIERVENAPGSGLVQLTAYGVPPPLTEGQRIAAPLRLHPVTGFRNPGTYDYAAHLAREGIY